MSQATTDLPEPRPEAAAAPSADDLLSQLAGDEIDRLLSEADVEKPADEVAHPPIDPALHDAPASPVADATVVASAAEPAKDPASAKENVSAQLDDLFDQLQSSAADEVIAAAAKPESAPAPGSVTQAATVVAETKSPPASQPVAEKASAVSDAVTPAESKALIDATPVVEADDASTVDEDAPIDMKSVPLMLKPLVWINAPLLACSASVRRNVGKVAIVTMLNAIAVLAYVIVTKKQ